ncbi:hypothetical protein GYMLUDRAFT_241984 [Collybiopsis luxurians FD-317 M1]|uniref:Unplaced genomic scaffold GYMLUscaffold_16, whole genome shotgun sequence n=1 Tax=Collybiopsis luxurians FD-317 M1 TaxID=944289 RepID=A0A0D0D2U0_9AGAR|nr:hypothetical protein GYMLUDRAFT_241984 [Collybiopsis luxurians FD-317 M1]
MASTEPEHPMGFDEIFKNAMRSIEDAEASLNEAEPVIKKAQESKEGRNKLVSRASSVVNTLLEPAARVADVLKFIGTFYHPCLEAGNALQAIVNIETQRRDSDVRIGVIHLEFVSLLYTC